MTLVSHSLSVLSVYLSVSIWLYITYLYFLSSAVGEHDGLFDNKRFFRCPEMHGVVVPIEEIHIIRPFDVSDSSSFASEHTNTSVKVLLECFIPNNSAHLTLPLTTHFRAALSS